LPEILKPGVAFDFKMNINYPSVLLSIKTFKRHVTVFLFFDDKYIGKSTIFEAPSAILSKP